MRRGFVMAALWDTSALEMRNPRPSGHPFHQHQIANLCMHDQLSAGVFKTLNAESSSVSKKQALISGAREKMMGKRQATEVDQTSSNESKIPDLTKCSDAGLTDDQRVSREESSVDGVRVKLGPADVERIRDK
ncbi:hypothetical protein CES87_22285 [Pseudomonas sp. ERMR1:02]|nr:hypothetical protein CES87_22285 [Pseudomonas sp. ERMR1:02]